MAEGFITRRFTPEPTTYIDASAVAFQDTYLSFDGVNDYVDLTSLGFNINDISSGSIELDIALYPQNSSNPYIVGARDGGSNSRLFIRVTDNDVINYRLGGTSANSSHNVVYGEKFNLRLEWSSNNYSVYINDVLDVGPLSYSGSGSDGDYDYSIGSSQTGSSGFTHMDLFYVKQTHNGNVFYEYLIDEGSGTTLNDNVGNNDGTIIGATWQDKGVDTFTYEDNGKFYKSHTFKGSGTFTVNSLSNKPELNELDYLIIAGGGGGGGHHGAGGGAGGYRTTLGTSGGNSSAESKITANVQSYTITVGGGGNGGFGPQESATPAQNGFNSSALGIVSTGGGRGASRTTGTPINAGNGGSGGGGATNNSSPTGGTGISNQGSDGGNGVDLGSGTGGGGGGAGQNGQTATTQISANGGDGLSNTLQNGIAENRAGGGGGGTFNGNVGFGGIGGGGDGAEGGLDSSGGNATINTGSGGGGGSGGGNANGGNGGSGIVIIRYEVGEL